MTSRRTTHHEGPHAMTPTLAIRLDLTIPDTGEISINVDLDLRRVDPARRCRLLNELHETIGGLLDIASVVDTDPAVAIPATTIPAPTKAPAPPPDPPTPTPPEPKATTPAKPKSPAKPASVTKTINEGTCRHAVLTAVADAGGTFEGSVAALGRATNWPKHEVAVDAARQLRIAGLLTIDRTGKPRTVSLTGDGWRAIGRTPTKHAAAGGRGSAYGTTTEPAPTVTLVAPLDDLAAEPISRTGFDPDKARLAAAGAL